MKVLVIGSLPPPVNDRSNSLLAEVLRYRAEGATVEVMSPTQASVAHRYLELSGPPSGVEIALAARGADVVVVQLQPGFPLEQFPGRASRAIGVGSLAAALRAVRGEVVLRLHSIHDFPLGLGGRAAEMLWARAGRIEAGDQETLAALRAALGPAAEAKVSFAGGQVVVADVREQEAELGGDADLAAVTGIVRARAASQRAEILADRSFQPRPRVAMWEWAPHPGAGVPEWANAPSEAGPQGSAAKRAARAVLYAAESRPATRPIARTARALRRIVTQA